MAIDRIPAPDPKPALNPVVGHPPLSLRRDREERRGRKNARAPDESEAPVDEVELTGPEVPPPPPSPPPTPDRRQRLRRLLEPPHIDLKT